MVPMTVLTLPWTSVTVSVQPPRAGPVPVLAVLQVTVSTSPEVRVEGAVTVTGARSGWVLANVAPGRVLFSSRPPSGTCRLESATAAMRTGPSSSAGSVMEAVTV